MQSYLDNIGNNTIRKNDYLLANSYEIQESIDEIKNVKGVVLLIAPSNSGKTVLLIDILNRIHNDYDKMRFFSRTMKLQKVYDFVPRYWISDDYDEEQLNEIWNKQIELHKQNKPLDKILIVLDDIISSPSYKKSKLLDEISISGRHLNITLILLSQNFTSIRPIVRNNAFLAIAFQLASKHEREKFVQQFMSVESARSGDILFRKITDVKYQAIVVNVWMVGCCLSEKIKKFTANPDISLKLKGSEDPGPTILPPEKVLIRPGPNRILPRRKKM